MSAIIRSFQVRAAADLVISANALTTAVRCLMARQIVWHLTATNANVLATITAEISSDNVNWFALGTGAPNSTLRTQAQGFALNVGGGYVNLIHETGGVGWPVHFPFRYARLNLLNGAVGTITKLAAIAHVVFESGCEQAAASYTPVP